MALTWVTLIGGFAILGVPFLIIWLNIRRRHAGWWLLLIVLAFAIVGNVVEQVTIGTAPLF